MCGSSRGVVHGINANVARALFDNVLFLLKVKSFNTYLPYEISQVCEIAMMRLRMECWTVNK